MDDALGVIEFSSIPAGYKIYNRILKDVYLNVYQDQIIAPGRFIIMIEGSYAGVNHAVEYAVNTGSNGILDYALIGNLHQELSGKLRGSKSPQRELTDLGLIETWTVCSGIELANTLLHGTAVNLVNINYDVQMHGKCLLSFAGSISSIQAALELAGEGELISNPVESVFCSIAGDLENN